ncbi:MAG: phosphate regulon sensor histidine kinase PhoR [Lysobacterales bacterium]
MTISPLLRSHAWQVSLGRLLLLLVAALATGLASGHPALAVLIALSAHTLWSLHNLRRLQCWLLDRGRASPLPDSGVLSEIAGFMQQRHQTDRQRQRRLVQQLQRYREAAESLPDGVLVLSNTRQLIWSNRAARRLLGIHRSRHRGQPLDRLLEAPAIATWLHGDQVEQPLLDVPAPGCPEVRLSLKLIPYSQEQWLLVVRDISTLLRLEQVRKDFVANVSHELRTPLTVIHGYLEMIETEHDPELAPMVEEMRRQSMRMTQIVEDLLTLSRLDADGGVSEQRVPMPAMLKQLRAEAEGVSKGQHRIGVECQNEVDLLGSSKELHSAFSNLVTNAVRYTPPGGEIRIAWQQQDGGMCFCVSDTGYGIPAEHLPRITERFYRVSTSRSRDKGGTGLGLSIVKHVLLRHQAQLSIESEPGVGSRFCAVFPQQRLLKPGALADSAPQFPRNTDQGTGAS